MSRPLTFGIKLLCGPFIVVIVFIGFFVMPAMASDRFVDHGDGTVTDTKTGLMWAAKDNGSPINWPECPFLLPKLQRWRPYRLADADLG